ncbi:peptide synthetase [Candidatus Magnetomorum sp. HK-1]|nr:peptide synthetase [Candidatus Magnetomorum sp. HK-1]
MSKILNKYSRPLARSERMWLVADKILPPYAIGFLIEGKGKLDKKVWDDAVLRASEANPGTRLKLKGFFRNNCWIDSGIPPEVVEIDGSNWSGFSSEKAPFLQRNLSPFTGPTSEILLIHGNPSRILFRSNHAVMDGRGVLLWIDDVFRALRGENILVSNSDINADQLARLFQNKTRNFQPPVHIAPTGIAKGNDRGCIWKRIELSGTFSKLLPKVAIIIAKEARKYSEGLVKIAIPVDLRHRNKNLRSSANLSIAIYLDVHPSSTPEQLAKNIKTQIENKNDCILTKGMVWFDIIPLWIMTMLGKKSIQKQHQKGLYSVSSLISNIGIMPIHKYHGGGFIANNCIGIPPGIENLPCMIVLNGRKNGVDIIVSIPKVLASDGRLDNILERISIGLQK